MTNFLIDEQGPTSVEYAVMLAFILLTCIATIKILGSGSNGMWGRNVSKLEEHGFADGP